MFRIILPKLNLNIERWKWNKEFRIYVSTEGHFKDEYKNNIPIFLDNKGYVTIRTAYGYKKVHRLVLLTWKPIPNAEDLTVDHLNHNKRDNSLRNLEWVSQKENQERANKDLQIENLLENGIIINKTKGYEYSSLREAARCVLACTDAKKWKTTEDNIMKKIRAAIMNKRNFMNFEWGVKND